MQDTKKKEMEVAPLLKTLWTLLTVLTVLTWFTLLTLTYRVSIHPSYLSIFTAKCKKTELVCPLARLRVFPTMIEPKNLSVVGPTTFFKISYAGLTSVGTLLKIARKEILSIEISIFFEFVEM